MRNLLKTSASLALAGAIGSYGAACWSRVTPEDQRLIEAAGCEEIIKEYRNFSSAEKKVAEEGIEGGGWPTILRVWGVSLRFCGCPTRPRTCTMPGDDARGRDPPAPAYVP